LAQVTGYLLFVTRYTKGYYEFQVQITEKEGIRIDYKVFRKRPRARHAIHEDRLDIGIKQAIATVILDDGSLSREDGV
jgi:hypothetical protein